MPLSKPINMHENINLLNGGVSEIRINQNKGDAVFPSAVVVVVL